MADGTEETGAVQSLQPRRASRSAANNRHLRPASRRAQVPFPRCRVSGRIVSTIIPKACRVPGPTHANAQDSPNRMGTTSRSRIFGDAFRRSASELPDPGQVGGGVIERLQVRCVGSRLNSGTGPRHAPSQSAYPPRAEQRGPPPRVLRYSCRDQQPDNDVFPAGPEVKRGIPECSWR